MLVANTVVLNLYRAWLLATRSLGGVLRPGHGRLDLPRQRGLTTPRPADDAWVVSDLVVALAAIAVTPWVKGPGWHSTVPGFWVMGAMFAWAHPLALARRAGCGRGPVRWTTSLTRRYLSETNYGNFFLLLVGGPIVGLMVDSLLRSAARTAAAERAAAAAAERARLARAVHDGVLQVLALVQRRGAELGAEGAELGRLAGEQEQALRALIRQQDAVTTAVVDERAAAGTSDLVTGLSGLERRPGVSVAAPPDPVLLPRRGGGRGRRRGRRVPGQRRRPRRARRAGVGAARAPPPTRCR